MEILSNRFFRLSLLVIGLLAIGGNFWLMRAKQTQMLRPPRTTRKKPLVIPPEGLATSPDTNGGVPGNPNRTIADMKRLFNEIGLYQKRHNGEYPAIEDGKDIDDDRVDNFKAYGYNDPSEAIKAFHNPDMKYSDMAHGSPQPETYFPYMMWSKRPDGTRIGSPKQAGTRDVLAYTDIYYHENIRLYKGDVTTTKPVGFYLVLWEDGDVTKVPYQDVQYAPPKPTGNGGATQKVVFPGQAGAPPEGVVSRAEYDKRVQTILFGS